MKQFWVLFFFVPLWADDGNDDGVAKAKSTGKSITKGLANFGNGMRGMAGWVSGDYKNSFEFWNDTNQSIRVKAKKIKNIMGMKIGSGTRAESTIPPYGSSGTAFKNTQLYFNLYAYDNDGHRFFYKSFTQPGKKNDETLYHYRAYMNGKGIVHGEYLGPKPKTTLFSGMIHNDTANEVTFVFPFASGSYKTVLDPHSSNMLNGLKEITNCVRPQKGNEAFLAFDPGGSIPIRPLALGETVTDGDKKVVKASRYNYLVYQNKGSVEAVETGKGVGNYSQPINGRIRDVSPAQCCIWHKSAAQEQKEQGSLGMMVPWDNPWISLWFVYYTPAWSSSNAQDGMIMGKIPPGNYASFFIIRPRLTAAAYDMNAVNTGKTDELGVKQINAQVIDTTDESMLKEQKRGLLFVVAVNTDRETVARAFLKKLATTPSMLPHYTIEKAGLTAEQKKTLLTKQLPEDQALIVDTVQGVVVKAALLLVDVFTSYGLGSGPFYYTVYPGLASLSGPIKTLLGHVDKDKQKDFLLIDNKTNEQSLSPSFMNNIIDWVALGRNNKVTLRKKVVDFFKQNGFDGLFAITNKKPDRTKLNERASLIVDTLVHGPSSLTRFPVLMRGGTNHYIFNGAVKPDNWPDKSFALAF